MDFEEFDDVVWRDFFASSVVRHVRKFQLQNFWRLFHEKLSDNNFFFEFFKGFPRILRRSEAQFFCFFGRATRAQVSTSKRQKRWDFSMDLDPSFIRIHLTTIFFRILQRISKNSSTWWGTIFFLLWPCDSCASLNFKTSKTSRLFHGLLTSLSWETTWQIFFFEFFDGFPRTLRCSLTRFFCFFGSVASCASFNVKMSTTFFEFFNGFLKEFLIWVFQNPSKNIITNP